MYEKIVQRSLFVCLFKLLTGRLRYDDRCDRCMIEAGRPGSLYSIFGLWTSEGVPVLPPCLVRPGRRLPVQGLSEGSLGFLDRLPAERGRDLVEALSPELPEIKEKSGICTEDTGYVPK